MYCIFLKNYFFQEKLVWDNLLAALNSLSLPVTACHSSYIFLRSEWNEQIIFWQNGPMRWES